MNHFYLHIPFCRQKCPYCKFALTPIFDDLKKRRYIQYLKKEIREYFADSSCHVEERMCDHREPYPRIRASDEVGATYERGGHLAQKGGAGLLVNSKGQKPKTIYFGGGTPSVLSLEELREILKCFPFYEKSEIEISFESNPEDITAEYVSGLFELGINRLSIGIQSLNDATLNAIHRSDRASIFRALDAISSVITSGKQSINIDFILGLPFSKPGETLENIREMHERYQGITHTSVYMLEDELYPKDWKQNSLSEDEIQTDFRAILGYFEEKRWNHYELSNFAKPGYECRHNQSYWDHSEYRGFGLSAASFDGEKRWTNAPSFSGYFAGKKTSEILTPEQIELEAFLFQIRTSGIDTDHPLVDHKKLERFLSENLLEIRDTKIHLTKTGIFLVDHIISELLK